MRGRPNCAQAGASESDRQRPGSSCTEAPAAIKSEYHFRNDLPWAGVRGEHKDALAVDDRLRASVASLSVSH
jgi:hypothetical protein